MREPRPGRAREGGLLRPGNQGRLLGRHRVSEGGGPSGEGRRWGRAAAGRLEPEGKAASVCQ